MELKLNVVQLFNVLLLLKNILNHVILLLFMMLFKYVLYDNFNDLVLHKKILKLILHVMVPHF
jgi:hypothetical protein